MFVSTLFAFQNIGDVTVKFIVWQWVFPQGVWEVVLFCGGAAIMWFFSLCSSFESRSKYRKKLKEKDEKIASLEQEKKSILDSVAAKQASEQTLSVSSQSDQTVQQKEPERNETKETAAQ